MEAKISHTSRVADVRVQDIEALKSAVQDLAKQGLPVRLEENGTCRLWSQAPRMPYVVKVGNTSGPNRFDVGFEKAKDGVGYVPVFDAHGGWLGQVLGQGQDIAKTHEERLLSNIGKLMQSYTVHALQNEAWKQGGHVQMAQQADLSYIMIVQ